MTRPVMRLTPRHAAIMLNDVACQAYVHTVWVDLRESTRPHAWHFQGVARPPPDSRIPARRVGSLKSGGAHNIMTENERRNGDVLTREDVLIRGLSVVGMVSLFLLILLMVNP